MKALLRFVLLGVIVLLGGVIFIRYAHGCSWKESFQIADQFLEDLIS
jgi:hypothetical protein